MKFFLLALVLVTGFGFVQPIRKEFVPPGTIKINDTLYADQAEISNFAWWEFEYSVKTKYGSGSKEHLAVMPDTSVWLNGEQPNPKMCRVYYRNPKFKDFPVVGISYEQAQIFCKWRTEMVKLVYARLFHRSVHLTYRLPMSQEWEMLAYLDSWKIRDSSAALLRRKSAPSSSGIQGPVTIYAYKKNSFGLYNTIGNVAEMTVENGLAKGGSWQHEPEAARTGKYQDYSGPQNWLGFRCVSILYKH